MANYRVSPLGGAGTVPPSGAASAGALSTYTPAAPGNALQAAMDWASQQDVHGREYMQAHPYQHSMWIGGLFLALAIVVIVIMKLRILS